MFDPTRSLAGASRDLFDPIRGLAGTVVSCLNGLAASLGPVARR